MHDLALEPWSNGQCRIDHRDTQLDLGSSASAIGITALDQNRKENYELFILDSCTNFSACSIFIYGPMGVKWTTLTFKQLAAQKTLRMDARYWLKRKASSCKRQAASRKRQATSLPQSGGKV